jgi:hypothetical protein
VNTSASNSTPSTEPVLEEPITPNPTPVVASQPPAEKPKKKKKKIISEKTEKLPTEATSVVSGSTSGAEAADATKINAVGYDLPPVMGKNASGGMRAADYDILKAASNEMFKKDRKKDTYDPYADEPDFDPWNKPKQEEGKSMRELMKEKMEKMKDVEAPDDRKARLQAQRDILVKQKQLDRREELVESKQGKSENKYSNKLFEDFLALDKKVTKEQKKKEISSKVGKDSPDIKPQEDNEAEEVSTKPGKKDMKSLFDDSDEEDNKAQLEKERKERQREIMKQAASENNF